MPKCSMCKKDVTWAVEAKQLVYGTESVAIDLPVICRNLTSIVQDLRSSWLPVTTSDPIDKIVQSLCGKCWETEMGSIAHAEGKAEPTYYEAAAKTAASSACGGHHVSGVYLNVDKADYKFYNNVQQDMATALSTTLHEFVHYLSAQSTGLQVDNDAVNYDECMTDFFAVKTYLMTFPNMKYNTNYGAKCKFFGLTKKNVWNKFAVRLLANDCKGLDDWPPGMKVYVKGYIESNPEVLKPGSTLFNNELKKRAARAFAYYMFRTLPMWYFGGQSQSCDEGDEWVGKKGATFADFKAKVDAFIPKQQIANNTVTYESSGAPGGYTELYNESENSG